MPDLRTLGDALVTHPLMAAPPLEDVSARAQRFLARRRRHRLTALVVVPLLAVAGSVKTHELAGQQVRIADTPAATTTTTPNDRAPAAASGDGAREPARPGTGATTSGGAESTATTATPTPGAPRPGGAPVSSCPNGRNAGATDVGVTAERVTIHVPNGDGAADGVREIVDRVNATGGICGRRIEITGLDPTAVRSPTPGEAEPYPPPGDYFALISGLRDRDFAAAVHAGKVDAAGIPVVGSDGLYAGEYRSRWTFPVGSSLASQARIITADAYERGARRLVIVFEERGGPHELEAKRAFDELVADLPGATVVASIGLTPETPNYSGTHQELSDACETGCDAALLAMNPETAATWFASAPMREGRTVHSFPMAGVSALASERFARNCGYTCDGLVVWSPFSLDVALSNAYPVARGRVAAAVLVEAMTEVGADLTRQRLRDALERRRYETTDAPPLQWGQAVPDARFANTTALPYQVRTESGSFARFELAGARRSDPRADRLPA